MSASNNNNLQILRHHLEKLQKAEVFKQSIAYNISCIENILQGNRYNIESIDFLVDYGGLDILQKCCLDWSKNVSDGDMNGIGESLEKIRRILSRIAEVRAAEASRCLKDVQFIHGAGKSFLSLETYKKAYSKDASLASSNISNSEREDAGSHFKRNVRYEFLVTWNLYHVFILV